ncbi:7-cyano-7-deazaguanine synthase [Yinghuangia sp. ASG 101]|uniref:7-cyano-7-deazaguanine synthase n=1 Tax=Yinghuangia sp. ASG 101 TaxID=2896848 RepID=UPI001E6223D2|nr:7-cyano-7-deazaguanine synthase [Yinghuangia sp. ASG 101]UGQ10502.1 7-cyano-7-deazaguanine synthase [Yinghuangia sp. ASG 101]
MPEPTPEPNPLGAGVLLFSAGLDSFPAWHFLGRPPVVYFDLRHRYAPQERVAVEKLAARCGMDLTISRELDLSDREAPDAIIPMRNAYFAMLAADRADLIWCIGVKGDHTADKSPEAFGVIGNMITALTGRDVRIHSPFWELTKTEIVRWYLEQGLPTDDLLLTFSCSRSDGRPVHCGVCPSCLRRWCSLVNNGIDAPFEEPPWQWERVRTFYVPAMWNGTYPDHRAAELFTALARVGVTV